MRVWLENIKNLWKDKFSFRLALVYLLAFVTLVLTLPILPLKFQPNDLDLEHVFQAPFSHTPSGETTRHLLGTDGIGRDVLANILYGAQTALFISFPVMLISSVIGILLGSYGAFYGDKTLRISTASTLLLLIAIPCALYLGLIVPIQAAAVNLEKQAILLSFIILAVILALLFLIIHPLLKKQAGLQKEYSVPLDQIVLRLTEVLTSIPRLIFILALASFVPPTVTLLTVILILTYWTGSARLARAEVLRLKQYPFIEAGASLGFKDNRLLWKHALPNMLSPLVVTFSFGLAGLMALESTLSFLGIGIPPTMVSWGRMIAGIRSNTSAWWLVVFPGAFLTATVLALQVFNYHLLSSIKEKKQH